MHIRWHYKESRSNKIAKGDKTPKFCRKWNFSTSLHESAPRCPWLVQRCSSGTLSCTGALLCTGAQLCTYALVQCFALVHNYSLVHFAFWWIRNLLVHLYRNITVVPSWHRRNSLAHMCRNIPLEHYFALVYFSSEALPILLLLQCKSALLTLV